ncbi:MAG: glutamate--cysteine ligase, partial [Alphaproteobacteria bacterium]|nr:glutamate--cysteine ligase [Alphaproteobacteria bacterium]
YDRRRPEIDAWLEAERKKTPPFFYTSVDLRHSGPKLAPVDTNLYPAGFNNLSPSSQVRAAEMARHFFSTRYPQARKLAVLTENHTRNLHYLENTRILKSILENAGFDVRLTGLWEEEENERKLTTSSERDVTIERLKRAGNRVETHAGFTPDIVISNNDFTSGAPAELEGIEQPVAPPVAMGWWRRLKSDHFTAYTQVADAFAEHFGIDPWLITTWFHSCGEVDFKSGEGVECVAKAVDEMIARIADKYAQYGITDDPHVFVKADSGTYGMGIMSVRSGEEMRSLNKKHRNQMQVIKGGAVNTRVIIQEGVKTADIIGGQSAEPVVYLIDGQAVGGFNRVNSEKDAYTNLNARGMSFATLCENAPHIGYETGSCRILGFVAELAAIAAAREPRN